MPRNVPKDNVIIDAISMIPPTPTPSPRIRQPHRQKQGDEIFSAGWVALEVFCLTNGCTDQFLVIEKISVISTLILLPPFQLHQFCQQICNNLLFRIKFYVRFSSLLRVLLVRTSSSFSSSPSEYLVSSTHYKTIWIVSPSSRHPPIFEAT
jgi:hypothetical protein